MNYTIVGLGELLWDRLPAGKQLGGAPANFAYHAAILGDRGIIVSRVGSDPLGAEAVSRLNELGIPSDFIQTDRAHRTGVVDVEVGREGQPKYRIAEKVAWDFLAWRPEWRELAARADAVCFGSLVQRGPCSRGAIRRFLKDCRPNALRIFDVNLREPFYSLETIKTSFEMCSVVKLNGQELNIVGRLLSLDPGGAIEQARRLLDRFHLELVCVTQGSEGCMLVDPRTAVGHPGFPAVVADTVGAGDAFSAALVYHLLRGTPLPQIAERANLLASWVVAHPGATPAANEGVLARVKGE